MVQATASSTPGRGGGEGGRRERAGRRRVRKGERCHQRKRRGKRRLRRGQQNMRKAKLAGTPARRQLGGDSISIINESAQNTVINDGAATKVRITNSTLKLILLNMTTQPRQLPHNPIALDVKPRGVARKQTGGGGDR
jgi:hypothetical protein